MPSTGASAPSRPRSASTTTPCTTRSSATGSCGRGPRCAPVRSIPTRRSSPPPGSGGAPRPLLYENLKSVLLERVGDHIRFHPRLLERAGHYHFAPQPCAPYRGNEKGKVERMIQSLPPSFSAPRRFASLNDLNAQLATWIAETAHARSVPGPAGRVVREAWAAEQPRLFPLPEHAFVCDLVRPVVSGQTPYIRFDGNDYSIPHKLIRRPLTLVASETAV